MCKDPFNSFIGLFTHSWPHSWSKMTDKCPLKRWSPLSVCHGSLLDVNNEAFSASHLIDYTQLFRWADEKCWLFSQLKKDSLQYELGSCLKSQGLITAPWLFFSADIHGLLRALTLDRCDFGTSRCERLLTLRLSEEAFWKNLQLMSNIGRFSPIHQKEWWCSTRRGRWQEAAGAPAVFFFCPSSLSSRFYQLHPPPAPKCSRRRLGPSRQGTCGCHLMGKKQVEMKASSRFCQSTSGLLSVTLVTFRVCMCMRNLGVFECAQVCAY